MVERQIREKADLRHGRKGDVQIKDTQEDEGKR